MPIDGLGIVPKAGTPIARDGDTVWTAPYDDTVLVMPSLRHLKPGNTQVRLGATIDDENRSVSTSLAALGLATNTRLLTAVVAQQSLTPIRASEHVYYFQGDSGMASTANHAFNSNAAFVVTRDGVVVFDALGTPELGAAMKQAIASRHDAADPRRHRQPLPRGSLLRPAGAGGTECRDLGQPRGRASLAAPRRRNDSSSGDATSGPMSTTRQSWWGPVAGSTSPDGKEFSFERGGVRFRMIDVGGAHSPEDIMLWVENDRVLLAGDLYFSGRIPFVGNADTRSWLATLDLIAPLKPTVVIPGHGAASRNPAPDIALTREYLLYLREQMGKAVRDLAPFDEAYAAVDWSRFEKVPAFAAANRINAYGTYLGLEQEALRK